ncbi:MAG: sugar transferase [Candidatus Eisenbacteria bacterium]
MKPEIRPVESRPYGGYAFAKRLLDVAGALTGLVVAAPLLVVTAAAIRLDSPGPALFRQRRVGRGSRPFRIVKFRTMRVGTPDLASHLMGPGSRQITRIGGFLRRTSIDELPQLWNVLRGDMSLVGPRPALHNQDDLIVLRREAGVDSLRPGLSGWAQIHGRDELTVAEKVRYDSHYLERANFGLDLWILLRTLLTLFSSRGVY